jgi:hypothetical protein
MKSQLTPKEFKQKYPEFSEKLIIDGECSYKQALYYFLEDFPPTYTLKCPSDTSSSILLKTCCAKQISRNEQNS